jgi:NitT/TauT family transport system substrate-binding protein
MLIKRLLLLLSISILVGCNVENKPLSVIVPAGTTQMAFSSIESSEEYDTTVVLGPDPLIAAFGSQEYDIIVAPTNLGAKLYEGSDQFPMVGTITWGNLYLISESTFTIDSLNNQDILVFGQGSTPDITLQYLLNEEGYTNTLTYTDSLTNVPGLFAADSSQIVLVAEPILSALELSYELKTLISLQDWYQDVTGVDRYPQASVFVNKNLSDSQIDQIIEDLEASINFINGDNTIDIQALLISLGITTNESTVLETIRRSNIGFTRSYNTSDDIEFYLNLLRDLNPVLVPTSNPSEDFYR